MTNLSVGSRVSLLSRERILFGVPLLITLLLAAGFGWFLIRPVLERVEALETRTAEIQALERQLPLLDRELSKASEKLKTAQRQQAVLIDLIAGKDRIQTFLASIDQISRATGVEIKRYEPLAEPSPAKQPQTSRQKKGKTHPPHLLIPCWPWVIGRQCLLCKWKDILRAFSNSFDKWNVWNCL